MTWLIIPNIIRLFDVIYNITLDISYNAHVYLFIDTVGGASFHSRRGLIFTVGGA